MESIAVARLENFCVLFYSAVRAASLKRPPPPDWAGPASFSDWSVVGYLTGGRLPEADVFAFRQGLRRVPLQRRLAPCRVSWCAALDPRISSGPEPLDTCGI